jgi:hypothetical protein
MALNRLEEPLKKNVDKKVHAVNDKCILYYTQLYAYAHTCKYNFLSVSRSGAGVLAKKADFIWRK